VYRGKKIKRMKTKGREGKKTQRTVALAGCDERQLTAWMPRLLRGALQLSRRFAADFRAGESTLSSRLSAWSVPTRRACGGTAPPYAIGAFVIPQRNCIVHASSAAGDDLLIRNSASSRCRLGFAVALRGRTQRSTLALRADGNVRDQQTEVGSVCSTGHLGTLGRLGTRSVLRYIGR
jgi:hypothetical protein